VQRLRPFEIAAETLRRENVRRALQAAPQKAWSGKSANVGGAQQAFLHRAEMNSLAALGKWTPELERKGRVIAAA